MAKRPEFPGLQQCLKMLRHSNPQINEDGYGWLRSRAVELLPQLIAAYEDEQCNDIRGWLIELIGEAKSPTALPFLLERMNDENESIREWALIGLRHLDTRESRTALWRLGLSK